MYVEDIMNMIRYIEICVGLGLGLGPFLGSLVYSSLRYQGTIYLFGFLNLFGNFFPLLANMLRNLPVVGDILPGGGGGSGGRRGESERGSNFQREDYYDDDY